MYAHYSLFRVESMLECLAIAWGRAEHRGATSPPP